MGSFGDDFMEAIVQPVEFKARDSRVFHCICKSFEFLNIFLGFTRRSQTGSITLNSQTAFQSSLDLNQVMLAYDPTSMPLYQAFLLEAEQRFANGRSANV